MNTSEKKLKITKVKSDRYKYSIILILKTNKEFNKK